MSWDIFWLAAAVCIILLLIPKRLLVILGFVLIFGALLDPDITKTWLGHGWTYLTTPIGEPNDP